MNSTIEDVSYISLPATQLLLSEGVPNPKDGITLVKRTPKVFITGDLHIRATELDYPAFLPQPMPIYSAERSFQQRKGMGSTDQVVQVYQLRIWIRKISPQIWRRLLVRSDSTIAELHDTCKLLSAG